MKFCECCLSIIAALWASVAISSPQSPSIRFVDQGGKLLAQVETVARDGTLYLPADALRRIVDSDMRKKYDLTGRLTLVLKQKRINLQLGTPSATIGGQPEPIALSHPPLVINQRPMLPITFFTELLPNAFDLEAAYNAELQRVRIVETRDTPSLSISKEGFLVVVNPGHGGTDTGCEGSDGVFEKNITLAAAKHVETYCKQNGIRVLLTRDGDFERRPLERVKIANQSGGQLFLSLHCNASYAPGTNGVHLYVNNSMWHRQSDHASTPFAGDVLGRREITTLSQEDFLDRSRDFASFLQEQLRVFSGKITPLTELPLTTLSEVYMPAILIELGYLSNAANQERLTEYGSQKAIADSIGAAIVKYMTALKIGQSSSDGE
ncbi:MAG: N-acetylmuramoyl-L-alanine amidase [Candidatus Poribacteria bacterium]|nr:N-acetylmuramoyl-L-alanine amidase [Candidatus Poribacteria bacterium]MDE0503742.1 N-acetylmuramoyl-L-alanine amidase [Candidatus Poribacteria bacterium]